MNGSPSITIYWREIDQNGQYMFQNPQHETLQTQPPIGPYSGSSLAGLLTDNIIQTDGLYYPSG